MFGSRQKVDGETEKFVFTSNKFLEIMRMYFWEIIGENSIKKAGDALRLTSSDTKNAIRTHNHLRQGRVMN
jgi:hypothetical protein